jgi:hypothetical protein
MLQITFCLQQHQPIRITRTQSTIFLTGIRMRKLILAAVLAAPLFAHADVINLVSNGGFEATDQGNGSWNIYSNLPGWDGGVAGIELRNNVAGTAFEGKNFVELDTTRNS